MDACAVNIYHLQRRACQWPLSMGSACGHEIAHICIYIYIYICVDIHVCGYSTVRRLGMALLASCTRMRWKHGQNPVSPSGCTYIRNDKKNTTPISEVIFVQAGSPCWCCVFFNVSCPDHAFQHVGELVDPRSLCGAWSFLNETLGGKGDIRRCSSCSASP